MSSAQSLVFYALVCSALALSPFALASWHHDVQEIMGTEIRLTLWHEDKAHANKAIAAVMAEMRRINDAYSPYIDSSELSQLNQNAFASTQTLSDELAFLIDKSLYFSRISQGAFDITFASVGWRYDYRAGKQPSDVEIGQLLPAINFRLLAFNKPNKTLKYGHRQLRIDLGGIAKGHAVDRAVAQLKRLGIAHASVSAGGDSRILGDRRGEPWMVGIKKPRGLKSDAVNNKNYREQTAIVLPLSNLAVSTSGDYERFFIEPKTGERIHHIINPQTGKSAKHVVSVTVLGPEGVDTDPLSTAVFVLGVEKGLALINRIPGFDSVIIDRFGKVHYSADLVAPQK